MIWYSLNCGDPTLCDSAVQEALEAFAENHRLGLLSEDAAIFSRHESRGDVHCELILYFAPEAEAVARAVGARCSTKPAPLGLSLIAGAREIREIPD